MPRWPVVLCFLWAATAWAADREPRDVAEYIERRELCEHFRQEPWPEGSSDEDRARRAFLVAQSGRYCSGADNALRALKRKYGTNKAVIERLERYEAGMAGAP